MGYVEIPSIDVLLPIYHGVGADILAKGVGHLPETSLPVGGKSTHAVLAGHFGMSNARLFTDLPELEIGDVFFIHIYNKTMEYTVDQIKTVLPTDTADLTIVSGQDYVTLITCVPVTGSWCEGHEQHNKLPGTSVSRLIAACKVMQHDGYKPVKKEDISCKCNSTITTPESPGSLPFTGYLRRCLQTPHFINCP